MRSPVIGFVCLSLLILGGCDPEAPAATDSEGDGPSATSVQDLTPLGTGDPPDETYRVEFVQSTHDPVPVGGRFAALHLELVFDSHASLVGFDSLVAYFNGADDMRIDPTPPELSTLDYVARLERCRALAAGPLQSRDPSLPAVVFLAEVVLDYVEHATGLVQTLRAHCTLSTNAAFDGSVPPSLGDSAWRDLLDAGGQPITGDTLVSRFLDSLFNPE